MQALRISSALLRLVMACYLLVLGIAAAAPFFHPQRMEVVCSAAGAMKMVALDHEAGEHTLDCSLCLAPSLPVPEFCSAMPVHQPLAQALAPLVAAHIAGRSGARFPPRGPPAIG